jgi:hypothetical protein
MIETSGTADGSVQRLLIEISEWDWNLFVGQAPDRMPSEQRFLGGLFFTQGIDVEGRVVSPITLSGKRFRISFGIISADIATDGEPYNYMGELHVASEGDRRADVHASTILPEKALAPALTALGSAWKFLHVWVVGEVSEGAPIRDYCFSRTAWDTANV